MTVWLEVLLVASGSLFAFLGALGMVRMPDLFTRMQAATKAGTLGVSFLFLAVALHFRDAGVAARSLAVVLFLFLTAPIAAHAIARAAYRVGVPLWTGTVLDEMRDALPGARLADEVPTDTDA